MLMYILINFIFFYKYYYVLYMIHKYFLISYILIISCSVCWSAPSNIAVIKYWGKRDTQLNLPLNSSISLTLHQDQLKAVTIITASKHFDKDQFWLNNE